MKEKATGRITISSDIEGDTVQDMLTHIYGGRIDNMEEKAGKLLADRLFAGKTATMDYSQVATTVYTPLAYGAPISVANFESRMWLPSWN